MKTKAGLLILAFAFCLTVSLVEAEATFGAWLPEDLLFSTTNAPGNPAIVAFNSPYYLVVGQDNQGSHPTFIQYAQAVGYSQSGNILTVNSTADPGDGVCTPTDCTLREAIIAANIMFGPVTASRNHHPGCTR